MEIQKDQRTCSSQHRLYLRHKQVVLMRSWLSLSLSAECWSNSKVVEVVDLFGWKILQIHKVTHTEPRNPTEPHRHSCCKQWQLPSLALFSTAETPSLTGSCECWLHHESNVTKIHSLCNDHVTVAFSCTSYVGKPCATETWQAGDLDSWGPRVWAGLCWHCGQDLLPARLPIRDPIYCQVASHSDQLVWNGGGRRTTKKLTATSWVFILWSDLFPSRHPFRSIQFATHPSE